MSDTLKGVTKTVLIVDDEPVICELLADYMTLLGYKPEIANDCNDVIAYFDTKTPDVVFLDIQLPIINGVQILRLIKRLAPELPVVMMSGVASVDIATDTLSYGAFDYVTKPFFYERIAGILRAIELSPMRGESN